MNAAVFEVHAMMVEDGDYVDSIVNIIETQQVNAEYAVAVTGDNFSKMFAEMDDDSLKQGQQMLRIFQKGLSIF